MDTTTPARPLRDLVHPSWALALAPVEPVVSQLGEFLRGEIAAGRGYLPAGHHVLRAFERPLDAVRVLVVGQDPYPTPGHAVGLSFSVAPDVQPVPRSLANIYRELETDLGLPAPSTGDLTPWADQGVLLLNRVLTVAARPAGQPPRPRLGDGDRPRHRGPGRARWPARRHPLGTRRARPGAAPARRRRASSRRTPARCRRTPASSARGRSAGPTSCSSSQGADPVDWRLP